MNDSHTLSDLLEPRSNFADKAKPARTETEATEQDYSAFARGRVGRRPQMMLAFQKCTGEVEVFAYSTLRRIQSRDPDRGFAINFGDVELTIEGQNLMQLFHYVCEHRAVEIVEAERTVVMSAEGESFVTRITRTQPNLPAR